MKLINLVTRTFKSIFIVTMFLGRVSGAHAENENCWAEFFENSGYTGPHFRLAGPVELDNLQNVNGENWASRIDSIKVGPKAKLVIFENINFKLTLKEMAKYPELLRALGFTEQDVKEDSELIFGANANIHDLSDFNFHNKIRSLKIDCLK
jgi:hypothetical protein